MRPTNLTFCPQWSDPWVLGPAVIGPAAHNGRVWTIPVDSALQHDRTLVRLALPATGALRAVVLVLPVQANLRITYGDGFSKGGFAALNLLLRHPDLIAGASIWDASMLRDRPTPDQLLAVAGSPDQVARYHIPIALRTATTRLGSEPRLVLGGYGSLRADQLAAHRQLIDASVNHRYYDGPHHAHRWDSGWVPHALDELTRLSTWPH
jgi:hypothetical protein